MKLYRVDRDAVQILLDYVATSNIKPPSPYILGYLKDNAGKILEDADARRAWLAANVQYVTKPYSGNPLKTMSTGFNKNIPWVIKRCRAIREFTEK